MKLPKPSPPSSFNPSVLKRVKFPTLFLFFLSAFSPFLFALKIPARPEGYVSDYAGLLPPASRARLEEELAHFEKETSNQIEVAIFSSLEEESLEDFSIRLAEQWKIGRKGKDNGVILLIFKNDRKVRIEVGYGLEAVLTDAVAKLIIENEITPRFREGKFDEGIERAVDALRAATRGEYEAERRSPFSDSSAVLTGAFMGLILPLRILQLFLGLGILLMALGAFSAGKLLMVYGFFFGALPMLVYFLSGRVFRGPLTLSRHGSRSLDGFGSGLGIGGFGGGGFGGGFGGGGGGGFGGGGASGGW